MNKDIKFCQELLLEMKNKLLSPDTDRHGAICRLHDARVKLFNQMNEAFTNTKEISKGYHVMLNYIDTFDVLMDADRDITNDLVKMTHDIELALGVKKN